jgi:hypothetical protein
MLASGDRATYSFAPSGTAQKPSAMPTQSASSKPMLKLVPYGMCIGAALLAGAALGIGLAMMSGWASGEATSVLKAGVMALTTWLIAAAFGAIVLVGATRSDAMNLGMGVLAASMARMLVALMLSLGVYFVAAPDGKTFFSVFLASGLVALMAEAGWGVRTLQRLEMDSVTTSRAGAPAPVGETNR